MVDAIGIDQTRLYNLHACGVDFSKEAGSIAFVTGRTLLFDLHQNGVGVAIDQHLFDGLNVSTLFPLTPQLVAAATKVDRFPSTKRFLKCLAIHPGHHQHLTIRGVLCDRGDDAT